MDPMQKFKKKVEPHMEKVVLAMKNEGCSEFQMSFTDVSGNTYIGTFKQQKE